MKKLLDFRRSRTYLGLGIIVKLIADILWKSNIVIPSFVFRACGDIILAVAWFVLGKNTIKNKRFNKIVTVILMVIIVPFFAAQAYQAYNMTSTAISYVINPGLEDSLFSSVDDSTSDEYDSTTDDSTSDEYDSTTDDSTSDEYDSTTDDSTTAEIGDQISYESESGETFNFTVDNVSLTDERNQFADPVDNVVQIDYTVENTGTDAMDFYLSSNATFYNSDDVQENEYPNGTEGITDLAPGKKGQSTIYIGLTNGDAKLEMDVSGLTTYEFDLS